MNTARFVLESMEKTSSRAAVATALEALTGASIGGTLGLLKAREGRGSDTLGSSDVAGAFHGAVLGALAGAGTGSLIRATTAQQAVRADPRLRSLAETAASTESLAKIRSANLEGWSSGAVKDAIYGNTYGGSYSTAVEAKATAVGMLESLEAQKADLLRRSRAARRAGTPNDYVDARLNDVMGQIGDTKLTIRGMNQKMKVVDNLERMKKGVLTQQASSSKSLAELRRKRADAYRKILEREAKAAADSRFFGIF